MRRKLEGADETETEDDPKTQGDAQSRLQAMPGLGRTRTVKMTVLLKAICRFGTIPIRIQWGYRTRANDFKVCVKIQRP